MTVGDEIVSLSAILLNEDYYKFIMDQKRELGNIILAPAPCLISLKIRAWLDLNKRRENNEQVDSNDIKKHKNDIFRLSQLLTSQPITNIPDSIIQDIKEFVTQIREEEVNFEQLGIMGTTRTDILDLLSKVYGITSTIDNIA